MAGSKKTSKFIREYGMTLKQLSDKYNHTTGYIWILHQRGELHKFIDELILKAEKHFLNQENSGKQESEETP